MWWGRNPPPPPTTIWFYLGSASGTPLGIHADKCSDDKLRHPFRVVEIKAGDLDIEVTVAHEGEIRCVVHAERPFAGDGVSKNLDLVHCILFEPLLDHDI